MMLSHSNALPELQVASCCLFPVVLCLECWYRIKGFWRGREEGVKFSSYMDWILNVRAWWRWWGKPAWFLFIWPSKPLLVPLTLHWVHGLYEEWGIEEMMELGLGAQSMKMFVGSCYRDQEGANIMSEICIVVITSCFNRPGVRGHFTFYNAAPPPPAAPPPAVTCRHRQKSPLDDATDLLSQIWQHIRTVSFV